MAGRQVSRAQGKTTRTHRSKTTDCTKHKRGKPKRNHSQASQKAIRHPRLPVYRLRDIPVAPPTQIVSSQAQLGEASIATPSWQEITHQQSLGAGSSTFGPESEYGKESKKTSTLWILAPGRLPHFVLDV